MSSHFVGSAAKGKLHADTKADPTDLGLGTMLWRPMSSCAGVIWGAPPAAGRAISSRFTAASNVVVSPATSQLQHQRPTTTGTKESTEQHPSSQVFKQTAAAWADTVVLQLCEKQLRRQRQNSAPAVQVAAAAGSSCEARSRGAPRQRGHRPPHIAGRIVPPECRHHQRLRRRRRLCRDRSR